ncbi:MAG: hypothetical protein GY720_13820, partial [bacterium]|nr:hypothetical protein [bacterium]
MQKNIRASEYHVTWQDQTYLSDLGEAYQAPNRAHNLRTYFAPDGVRVIPRTETESSWELGLTLTGYGYVENVQPVLKAELLVSNNGIEYRRGKPSAGRQRGRPRRGAEQGITEWYVNDEQGLEQGFTIAHRPPATGGRASELVLDLAVSGDLTPNPSADGTAIEFTTSGGVRVLRYGELYAYDATGRELPTRLVPLSTGEPGLIDGIRLLVDDTDAVYPIIVDPLLTTPAAWTAESDQAYAFFGYSVGTAGDVNDDDYDDVIIGAPFYDNGQINEGRAYVYTGTASGLSTTADWTAEGDENSAYLGYSVGTAGDVDGDDYSDVIVSAYHYTSGDQDEPYEAHVYGYYGSTTGLSTSTDWSVRVDQSYQQIPFDGISVGTAGDVNDDGYADVIVGTPYDDDGQTYEGRAFVYHGSSGGLGTTAAWTAESDQASAGFGYAVGTAGDINGDGYADVIVGAPSYDNGETNEGRAYVYTGTTTGLSTSADWTIESDQASAELGRSVGTAGDVNGDGYDDVIVGAPKYDNGETDEGRATVYHGATGGLDTTAAWTVESDQASAGFGGSVGTAGDVDGDGYDDVIVGASGYDNGETDEGQIYVYNGSAGGVSLTAAWTAESDQASASFGYSVGTAGDVNGDGYDDVIAGAPYYDNGETDEGRTYVYHGSSAGLGTSADWVAESDQASAHFGMSVSTAGDVNGDGYKDVIVGALNYDGGQAEEGRVYVYRGSVTGLETMATWITESNWVGSRFGKSVGAAGDINGDGYDDIIVGAHKYSDGQTEEGRVYVYTGTATGLSASADWTIEGNQSYARLGVSVGGAGDVNGDSYADIIVGALLYDNGQTNEGRAYVYHGSSTGLTTGSADWTVEGDQAEARLGFSVSTAGDVNGDGYADVIVGAYLYDGDGNLTDAGQARVYHGSGAGLNTTAAWTAEGENANDEFGIMVGVARDVNGDGYSDVIVGARYYDGGQTDEGRAYVYHGSATGLDTSAAWMAESQSYAYYGVPVSTAGDVNGDGYSDVIVGAPGYDGGQTDEGRVYIYHGSSTGLTTGSADWTAESDQPGAMFGASVSTAGDVNGDGYDDIIVGAYGYDNGQEDEGRAYVYYGSATGLDEAADWSAEGDQAEAYFGWALGTAGDVNGDDYSDVIVGAYLYDNGQTNEGRVYVYTGTASGLSTTADWTAESDQASAEFGFSVDAAGDVNGDGYSDIIVGARRYDNNETDEGGAFVYHGSATGLSTSAAWTAVGNQDDAAFGSAVSTAGDVNGDGYSDIIIGARRYNNGEAGEGQAYVYHGSATGLVGTTADWMAESNQSWAMFGFSVNTAGDVNGDGYDDVIVGALQYDNGETDEGRVYVYTGTVTGLGTTADWTAESDQASAKFGRSVGTAGDVNGDGYADVIIGAFGYDSGQTNEGRTYVYTGTVTGLSTTADWMAEGNQDNANFGYAVSTAGDVNGDGYADVIIGAQNYDNGQANEGRVYIYHGSSTGITTGSANWTAESDQANAWFGSSVSTAGDVNGDGYADVIVGALYYDNGQTDEGGVFVYHGSAAGLDSSSAWTAESDQGTTYFGWAAGTAGDVNGDGYDDVIVSAPYYDNGQTNEGRAYVYTGTVTGLSTSAAWTAESDQADANFGYSVGAAGDVNGDGYDDVIVGANLYDNDQTDEGRSFVYHGSSTGLTTGSADWSAESDQASAEFGYSVGTAGDVNGDGYADVIVGADHYDNDETNEGRAYVYHGSTTGLSMSADWITESNQAEAQFGCAVGTAGDVNGDGYSDIIVGARKYDNGEGIEGRTYVYYGSVGGLSTTADWTTEGDRAYIQLGHAVGTAGDVNGDGYSDIIVGARAYDNGHTNEGAAFVYHGSMTGLSTTADWTAEGNHEMAKFGVSVGTAGDVNGDGYSDVIVGAHHYDNGQTDEGRVFVYHGSATGLKTAANWTAESNQDSALFGWTAGTAGDVNGDGYADVIVGAHLYDNDQIETGQVFLYYGNGGDGLDLTPRQLRSDGSAPIAPLGMSDSHTAIQIGLTGRSPAGRQDVKLQWQVAPLGTSFGDTGVISGTSAAWTDVLTTGVTITQNVSGLTAETAYHWRARLLYRPGNPLGQTASRWVHAPWNGWNETDFRTAYEPPTVVFTGSPTSGVAPLEVSFTDQSTGVYDTCAWAFGDGGDDDGCNDPSYTYTLPGVYTVSLAVNGLGGSDVLTRTHYITAYEAVVAGFTAVPTSGVAPLEVSFADQSSGAYDAWEWNFGDGMTSTLEHPTHTYTVNGSYTISLAVSGPGGSDILTHTGYIAVSYATITRTIDYDYDPLYRLTAADHSSGLYYEYQYDGVGNRTQMSTLMGVTSYVYDDANRLTSVGGVTYTYDDNGNLLSDGTRTFAYDA